MMRYVVILILLMSSILSAISVEDEAKLKFGEVYDLWAKGEYEKAREVIEDILYKPIDVNDITKFWYLRARIDIDMGNVEEAFKSLQSVLVVNPTSAEVLALIRELEYLTGKRKFEKSYRLRKLALISGFKDSVEYFYTVDDFTIWGNLVFMVDRVNSRLLEYANLRLIKTIDLPFHPFNVEVSPGGKVFVSGSEGGVYRIDGESITEIATSLGATILAGFDRSGTLWGISGLSVLKISGNEVIRRDIPWGRPIITDAEITKDGLWILDALHRRLVLMDPENLDMIRDIPLSGDIRAFEVTPYGDFILLTCDEKMIIMDEKQNLKELDIESQNIVPIEYCYPILMVGDWRKHEVRFFSLAGNEPVIVKVDKMEVDHNSGDVELKVRFEDLYGDPLNMVENFVFVSIDEGRVKFDIEYDLEKVEKYTSDIDFIVEKLMKLKRGIGYDVLVPENSFVERKDLVVLRDKSVRIFTRSEPKNPVLKQVILMSGGGWFERGPVESVRHVWKVKTRYTPSISTKIIPVSVGLVLGSEMFMDTVYIVERGITSEGE